MAARSRQTSGRSRGGADIDVGRSVGGWVVHVALGAVVLAGFAVVTVGSVLAPVLLVLAAVGLVAGTVGNAVRPGYGLCGVALGLIMLPFFGAPVGYTWKTPVLVVVVHAIVRLSWLGTLAGPTTKIDTGVLVREGRRSAVFNLAGQVVALVAGAITAATESDPSIAWEWFAVIGGVAALALAAVLRHGLPTGQDTSTEPVVTSARRRGQVHDG